MYVVPAQYFVVSGSATSGVSSLNAFDIALLNAGVSEQNLVAVSSVIPENATEIGYTELPMGAVTHCVISEIRGFNGERISSGIAYALREDGHGGYVVEGHNNGTEESLKELLKWKIDEMARIRGIKIKEVKFRTEHLEVPLGQYGACVSILVFCSNV